MFGFFCCSSDAGVGAEVVAHVSASKTLEEGADTTAGPEVHQQHGRRELCCSGASSCSCSGAGREPTSKEEEVVIVQQQPIFLPKEPCCESPYCNCNTFRVTLCRTTTNQPWGLKMDFASFEDIHVSAVQEASTTPVTVYNGSVPSGRRIQPGDYILEVNDLSVKLVSELDRQSPAQHIHDAVKSRTLKLVVARPRLFECEIWCEGEPLALQLNYTPQGSSLLIISVDDGAARRCAPEIQPGDRIIAVGGLSENPKTMLQALQSRVDPLQLKVSRR